MKLSEILRKIIIGNGLDKTTTINILNNYKKSWKVLIQRDIHVALKRDEKNCLYIELDYGTPGGIIDLKAAISGRSLKDFNQMLKDGYAKDIVDAMVIINAVQSWLENTDSPLTEKEKIYIFDKFVNVDLERKNKADKNSEILYKGLSYDEISEKYNKDKKTIRRSVTNGINKIIYSFKKNGLEILLKMYNVPDDVIKTIFELK